MAGGELTLAAGRGMGKEDVDAHLVLAVVGCWIRCLAPLLFMVVIIGFSAI